MFFLICNPWYFLGNSEQKINTFDKSKNNNESTSTASSDNHSFYQNKLKKAAMALRLASLGSSQDDAKSTPSTSQLSPNSLSNNSDNSVPSGSSQESLD
ncbi:hypothetical protein HHI36_005850 [Cryptolaemus montrouzieri]|uniref:Uncharacterized protein n=1 Tax=Cryptolaemus montrouzieri TaxID=559131 RepID=A0ABD2NVK6_9CUCU